MKSPFSKYLYIGFLLLGLFQACFSKDYIQAAASLGIGLAFDPFNPEQKWNDRPTWQKAVLNPGLQYNSFDDFYTMSFKSNFTTLLLISG